MSSSASNSGIAVISLDWRRFYLSEHQLIGGGIGTDHVNGRRSILTVIELRRVLPSIATRAPSVCWLMV